MMINLRRGKMLAVLLVLVMIIFLLTGCNEKGDVSINFGEEETAQTQSPVAETEETAETEQKNETPVTLEEIQAKSGDDYACVTGENGFVTFLRGKFYDDPVVNEGDAEKVLNSVQHLIVGDDDITLRLYGVMQDDNGYFYYTYHQLSGETTVEGAMLKLVVGPDGPTVCRSRWPAR